MTERTLHDILADSDGVAGEIIGDPLTRVADITLDSRQATQRSIFACVRGMRADGHGFAQSAIDGGASALLVDHLLDVAVPQLLVADTRLALGPVSAATFAHPARSLQMVGITGTNGKTTTAQLFDAIAREAGRRAAVIGTLTGTHTTPEAPDLQRQLRSFVEDGCRTVTMEVSSHALALHRVDGIVFDVAVFTNLGHDHLDLHGDQQRYFAAKARLFDPRLARHGVTNVDDVHGRLLADSAEIPISTYSIDDARNVEVGLTGHRYEWRGVVIDVPLGGAFNVSNSLAAATAAAALGYELEVIATGLRSVAQVPGRFEVVDAGQAFTVVVDFAHTPDGLAGALGAARQASAAVDESARVIVVFGCGGDRDPEKRAPMGEVASRLADLVVITSDNPRSEDPDAIAASILSGVSGDYRDRVMVDVDRRSAIARALRAAQPGDVVVIAGKGHEATQTIGPRVVPFDDRAVARALLENLT